ncbi:OmpA family protein [Neisseriaceae bacterium ESL0693]|nr:OmpA family protein [Neisseriaceae bacterium ESL0693]
MILTQYFIWGVWAIYWPVKICLSVLTLLIAAIAAYWRHHRQQHDQTDALHQLPKVNKIILVAGDSLSHWIEAGQPWRLFRDTLWLRVDRCAELCHVYQTLNEQNQIPAGIFLILNPDSYRHITALEQNIAQWRQEIETLQGIYKRRIPVTLGVYTDLADDQLHFWPDQIVNQICRQRSAAADYFNQMQQQLDGLAVLAAEHPDHITYQSTANIYLSQRWLQKHVINNLLPDIPYQHSLYLNACVWLNSHHTDEQAAWRLFEIETTGLVTPARHQSPEGLHDFPKIEVNMIRQRYLGQGGKYLCYAINCLLLFLIIGGSYSYSQNRQWIQEIIATHQKYIALPLKQENERLDAISELKKIQQTLQNYQAYGEPARMGFGLYHATRLLPIINDDINHFQIARKQVVRLDTTALFDVGQSHLKNDAKLSLQGILTWIQANPNQRVLIDGYTDNTGDDELNRKLSLARAQAVRDWLVNASTFNPEHFTVQGHGASQPIATNDNDSGRSKNRRVEITLVDMPHRD